MRTQARVTSLSESAVVHSLYGIRIRTPWPLRGVKAEQTGWDVEFVRGDRAALARAMSYVPLSQRDSWAQGATLPDGSNYRRWNGLFEFVVSPNGRQIHAGMDPGVADEALLAYLLVDALSFSMIRLGWEPLHASAVHTEHGAAAFLGDSGRGKSTLSALFVSAGLPLVTDDMLVLMVQNGQWWAQPGPPRIKLYRHMAQQILPTAADGVPMNSRTEKLILPLAPQQTAGTVAPITALYLLEEGRAGGASPVAICRLTQAQALPRVLAATAGHFPFEADRLKRQFAFVTSLVRQVPVMTLTYPRDTAEMHRVRDAVLLDLQRLAV